MNRYYTIFFILFFAPMLAFAQKGPGGVGDTDGLTNLSVWLDAAKITGVGDGGDVEVWEDQSGNGYDATVPPQIPSESVVPTAPTFSPDGGGNGRPSVNFNKADFSGLSIPGNSETKPTNEITVFAIGRINDANNYTIFLSSASDDNDNDGYGIFQAADANSMRLWTDDYGDGVTINGLGTVAIWNLIFNTTDNENHGYKNESTPVDNGFNGPITYKATGPNNDVTVGIATDNNDYDYFSDGHMEEIIIFDVAINDAQRIIIANYLAAKYDISLVNNDVYNEDDNGDFDFDVAGIGRVDASNIHNDAQGTGIIRILSPTGLGNDEFLMWGHDNSIAMAIESSDVPGTVDARFDRVWRASEVNTSGTAVNVGNIDMRFDLSGLGPITASDLRLLVDADGTFATGATEISGATDLGGNIYEFSGVSAISNNQRFTIATEDASSTPLVEVPGGVAPNLALWLKANDGTSTTTDGAAISLWNDQSGNGNDVGQATGANQPTFQDDATNNINFNPVIDFDGSTDVLLDASGILGTATYNDVNVYSVVVTDVAQNSFVFNEANTGGRISASIPWGNSIFYWDAGSTDANDRLQINWGGTTGTPYLWSSLFSTTSGQTISTIRQAIIRNGLTLNSDNTASNFIGNNSQFNLGSDLTNEFNGKIAEMVIYTGAIDATQHNQIESYLAIKYGITLSNSGGGTAGDYTASDGATPLWDASANSGTYHNDVAGIGRDDLSALDQQQSLSINSDAIVTMDKGTAFSNDKDFILWGNDNNPVSTTTTGAEPSFDSRLERTWIAEVAGTPGNVSVTIDFANDGVNDHYALHVDADGDFTAGSTTYMASIISGNSITFSNVSLPDGNFFTLGVRKLGPGGVTNQLAFWINADEGVTSSPSVSQWLDQSGNGYDMDQGTGSAQPTMNSSIINYNPAITFDGSSDYMPIETLNYAGAGSIDKIYIFTVFKSGFSGASYNDNWAFLDFDRSDYFTFYLQGSGILGLSYNAGGIQDIDGTTTNLNDDDSHLSMGSYDNSLVNETILRVDGANDYTGDLEALSTTIGSANTRYGMVGDGSEATTEDGSRNNIYFDGEIAEICYYEGVTLSSSEIRRIESYLAVKYAITLDNAGGGANGDYLASDGTNFWDADADVGYQNEIIAIGRDDKSGLLQKQSHHQHDSLRIFIDALAADNAANTGTITNDTSFIVIGHNGAKQRAQPVEMPAGVKSRFGREWKVTNTNFDEDFSLEIEWDNNNAGGFDITQIRLLVDTDDDFSDASILGPADGLTFANGSIIVGNINSTTHIPKNSTRFITIASINRGVPLPIELISFKANVTDKHIVELIWQTASEINNDFFTIEKSKDAEIWNEVSIVDGAGNSSEKLSYSAEDKKPYGGISYYRLKQTDFDGKFTYSDIKVVTLNRLAENEIHIYPNPGTEHMTIEGNKVELAEFAVYNIYGQNVTASIKIINQNVSAITIDISRLSNGIYTLKTKNHIRKIIKQ